MKNLEKTVCITTLWEIDTAVRDGDNDTIIALCDKVKAIALGEYF